MFNSTTSAAQLEDSDLTNELSTVGTGYARVDVSAFFGDAPVDGVITNTIEAVFAQALAQWDVAYGALMDHPAAGSGNVISYSSNPSPVTVEIGETYKYNVGNITNTLT